MLKSAESETVTPQESESNSLPRESIHNSYYNSNTVDHGLLFASFCSCSGFLLAFYATVTPYFLWALVEISTTSTNGIKEYASFATGPFILALTTGGIQIDDNTTLPRQIISWDDITSSAACTQGTDVFENWSGKYGFCQDGEFKVPSTVLSNQVLVILTSVAMIVAVAFSVLASSNSYKKTGHVLATIFSLFGFIAAITNLALVTLNPWYIDLLNGEGYLPIIEFTPSNTSISLGAFPVQLVYGPAFYTLILVFMVTMITLGAYLRICFKLWNPRRVTLQQERLEKRQDDKSFDWEPTFVRV